LAVEFNSNGYEWIRETLIRNSSIHIELQNDNGNAIVRLPLSDSRVSWTHTQGNNPMELSVEINGSDSDIPLPVTIDQGVLFPNGSSTDSLGPVQSVSTTELTQDADKATIKCPLEVPKIV